MRNVNLQLFAAGPEDEEEVLDIEEAVEEEIEDEGQQEEETEESTEEEQQEEVVEDDAEEETEVEPVKKVKDKKDYAIIEAKRKAKQKDSIIKELQDKLSSFESAEQNRKDEIRKSEIEQKYIQDGWHADAAKRLATQDFELEKLKHEIRYGKYESKAEKLESRFPDIWNHLDKLIDLCEKTGWTLERVCKVELDEQSPYDSKVKDEQAELIKKKSAAQPKTTIQSSAKLSTTKLSPEDEAAYAFYAKRNPGVSKKQYYERIIKPRLQED